MTVILIHLNAPFMAEGPRVCGEKKFIHVVVK